MHFSRMKGRSFVRSATATVVKRAQLALLLCGLLGIASKLLVSGGTMANPYATGSNSDEPSRGQGLKKAPPGMVWIPGGTFLMGTNDKESFPNERPAHFVQVQGFWMDAHDVTNAEFSKASGASSLEKSRQLPAWLEANLLSQNRHLLTQTTQKTNEI